VIASPRESFDEEPGKEVPIGDHDTAMMTEKSRQWAEATQALLLHPHRRMTAQWPQRALR